jgi:acyl dehydratase
MTERMEGELPSAMADFLEVGKIVTLPMDTITRTQLALYAGASGDHNPIHIDIDFARAAGMPDVFAHGMLGMAYLGRLLTSMVGPECIRGFSVRFVSIINVGDRLICSATVTRCELAEGVASVTLELSAANQAGDVKIVGAAELTIPLLERAGR